MPSHRSASPDPSNLLSCVRIWQWSESDSKLVARHCLTSGEHHTNDSDTDRSRVHNSDVLEQIKQERHTKALKKEWRNIATWIHVPRNNVSLCKDVLERVCQQGQSMELNGREFLQAPLHEVFEPKGYKYDPQTYVKAPFMNPFGRTLQFDISNGAWKRIRGHPRKDVSMYTSVLYMPYLHWNFVDKQNMETLGRSIRQPNLLSLPCVGSGDHPRRSLDEAHVRTQAIDDLVRLNRDQVVTRYWLNSKEQPHPQAVMMVVDQLWLWVLDNDTILTSFPDSPATNLAPKDPSSTLYPPLCCDYSHTERLEECHCLFLECLVRKRFKDNAKHGASELARTIINRSSSIFLNLHKGRSDLRFMDIFRHSIEDERLKCTNLLMALPDTSRREKSGAYGLWNPEGSRRRSQRTQDPLKIQEDIQSVWSMRDIEEELKIIAHIVRSQIKALDSTTNRYITSQLDRLAAFKIEVEDLQSEAKLIHERLFQTLELKQALSSIRQNDIVLLFTVVTIIFLPLGFISSIFGMNAIELSDGSPVSLRTIFAYMFPISAVISLIALGVAFRPSLMRILHSTWRGAGAAQLPVSRQSNSINRHSLKATGVDRALLTHREGV